MIRKVFDISDRNLGDVPRRLRMLADDLEAGGTVRSVVCIIEHQGVPLDIVAFGRDADQIRSLGLIALAQSVLGENIDDYGTHPRYVPPDPVA